MIPARALTPAGIDAFRSWLASGALGGSPDTLLADSTLTEPFSDREVDPSKAFNSRYEFGCYLKDLFAGLSTESMLAPESDGMWAWINAVYFRQLAPSVVRKYEHYIPVRRGSAGSLTHRCAARTAYELLVVHGENARFALQQKMHTHGQLLESLTASQSIVRNHSFFAAAAKMYVGPDGKIKRGAGNKPKKPKDRKPGDESGKGSIRRLPVALKRLDLTYDVEVLAPDELVSLLPKEYARWTRPHASGTAAT